MATVNRLITPTSAQINQGAQKSDTVPYIVTGLEYSVLKGLVLAGIGLTGLPKPGVTPHPDHPGMICRSVRVQQVQGGDGTVSEVYADFATSNFPGAGLLHGAVDVSGGQFVLSATFQDVDVQLPVARLRRYTASVDGSEVETTAWAVEMETVTETRMILRARWGIQGQAMSVAQMRIFGEESNHLHEIGGNKYLFLAGSVAPRDNITYEVNASWELDTGTPEVNSDDPTAYMLPGDMYYRGGGAGAGLCRDPYHKLIATPAVLPDAPPDDVASWPLLAQVPYAVDGDHTRLPGIPQL